MITPNEADNRSPLLVATACMFSGFYGLNRAYIDEDRGASPLLLAFYMFLTGVGSCAGILTSLAVQSLIVEGFNAALNAAAKNFPASRGNLPICCKANHCRDSNGFSSTSLSIELALLTLCRSLPLVCALLCTVRLPK